MEDKDHDILIEIRTDQTWIKTTLIDHMKEEAANSSLCQRDIKAAHKRIDWVLVTGILTIILFAIGLYVKK